MIGHIFRLVDVKRIEMKQREIKIEPNTVLVRPEYMSICAADQRYYLGQRKRAVLDQKLPMALIHEATGIVLADYGQRLPTGAKVILLPLAEGQASPVKGNYRADSSFASSDADGFMRDVIALPPDRLIGVENDSELYVFSELLSVALSALSAFEKSRRTAADVIGVWGDGNMGFVMALAVKCLYPASRLYVFGKHARKFHKFPFADKTFFVNGVADDVRVDHAFECVGGKKSEEAIVQMVDRIRPQGVVSLLGVSEDPVNLNTRKILEKGLFFIGNSRSDKWDIQRAAGLIAANKTCRRYLKLLVSESIEVNSESDIPYAFEQDILDDFKTVIRWNI